MDNLTPKEAASYGMTYDQLEKLRNSRWSGAEHYAGIKALKSQILEILQTPDPENRPIEDRVAKVFDWYVKAMLIKL